MKIELVNVSAVREGEWIAEVDNDTLTSNETVNEEYSAADQRWVRVINVRHQADISHLTYLGYDETVHTATGDGNIWRLVNDAGQPVTSLSLPGVSA